MKLSNIILKEHMLYEGALANVADDIASMLDKNLSDEDKAKLKQAGEEQNEIVVSTLIATGLSVIGTALTLNAIIYVVGKYGAKLLDSMYEKETEASKFLKKAYHWAHDNETAIIKFLGTQTAGRFTKNEQIITIVGAVLFIILLLGLGAAAGVKAVKAVSSAKYGKFAKYGMKVLFKGKDIKAAGKEAGKAIIDGVSPDVSDAIASAALSYQTT